MNRREHRAIISAYRNSTLTNNQTHTQAMSLLVQAAQQAIHGGPSAVRSFMAAQGYPQDDAWCGLFAASVVRSVGGTPPPHPEVAGNWLHYGTRVRSPQVGDIAVLRGRSPRTGVEGRHVTFVGGVNPVEGTFTRVGGNQGATNSSPTVIDSGNIADYYFRRPPPDTTPTAQPSPSPAQQIASTVPHEDIPLSQPPPLPDNIPPTYEIPLSAPPSLPDNIPSVAPAAYDPETGLTIGTDSNFAGSLDYGQNSGFSIPADYGADFLSPSGQFGYFPASEAPASVQGYSVVGDPSYIASGQGSAAVGDQNVYATGQGYADIGDPAAYASAQGGAVVGDPSYIASAQGGASVGNPDEFAGSLAEGQTQTPSSGDIVDNPFANPFPDSTAEGQTEVPSSGDIVDNPFLGQTEPQQQQIASAPEPSQPADPMLASLAQGSYASVPGTFVNPNTGQIYQFNPQTGSYNNTGWTNRGYGAGSPYGAGSAGFAGGGFGGYGGLGSTGAPVMGHINTGINDTSVFQSGGVDPTGMSSPGPGIGLEGIHTTGTPEVPGSGSGDFWDSGRGGKFALNHGINVDALESSQDAAAMAAQAAAQQAQQYPLTWALWKDPFGSSHGSQQGAVQTFGGFGGFDPTYRGQQWYPTSYTTDPTLAVPMPTNVIPFPATMPAPSTIPAAIGG